MDLCCLAYTCAEIHLKWGVNKANNSVNQVLDKANNSVNQVLGNGRKIPWIRIGVELSFLPLPFLPRPLGRVWEPN